jgi:hypothetical protein
MLASAEVDEKHGVVVCRSSDWADAWSGEEDGQGRGIVRSLVDATTIRGSTVHKVKGESLEAVMYVASKEHVRALLDGTATEVGRIGYVAVTRARDLFVLAVPDNCLGDFEDELVEKGFRKPGVGT